ncbi:MAG: hypothetical protein AAFO75_00105 [Pseudomonadota bacterium]
MVGLNQRHHRGVSAFAFGFIGLSAVSASATAQNLRDDWADCRSGTFERVVPGCTAIIERAPAVMSSLAEAYYLRAIAYIPRGDVEKGLQDLNRALTAKPDFAKAFLERGRIHEKQGRYLLAKRDYEQAVAVFDAEEMNDPDSRANPSNAPETTLAFLPVPDLRKKATEGVERLEKLGGLVSEPSTVPEFFNNAQVYERRGDQLSARRMYERAIAKGSAAVDLHQGYLALLKAQEGMLGAREIYADLARSQRANKAIALMFAVLQPASKRERALRALVSETRSFGPAWLEIAKLFSLDRLGDQSLTDKQNEKRALEGFVAADKAGDIYTHYLDKTNADKARDTVQVRLAPYQNRNVDISPVSLSAMASNSGWMVTINIAEPTKEIRYAVGNAELKSTGFMDFVDQRTGSKMPRMFFNLPLGMDAADIYISYDDVRGQSQGPFRKRFVASEAHTANAKNILENITPKWVEGRAWAGKYLVYFTHLVGYTCGLSEIRYGIGETAPDKVWPMPTCNPKDPYAIKDNAKIYATFKGPPKSMTIQLTYRDGSVSPVKSFSFP